jgi:hypothetical protein
MGMSGIGIGGPQQPDYNGPSGNGLRAAALSDLNSVKNSILNASQEDYNYQVSHADQGPGAHVSHPLVSPSASGLLDKAGDMIEGLYNDLQRGIPDKAQFLHALADLKIKLDEVRAAFSAPANGGDDQAVAACNHIQTSCQQALDSLNNAFRNAEQPQFYNG